MPYTAVRVVKPVRALVLAALQRADGPLAQAVDPGNRRTSGPVVGNKSAPGDRPALGLRWTGGDGTTGFTAAETFATLAPGFDPASPPPGITRLGLTFEVVLDTRNYATDEAADLFDDACGSLYLAGPRLGDGRGQVVAWTVGGVRVDDTANDTDTRDGRGPSPGKANHRVTFTLRVSLEIHTADIVPQEV